MGQRHSKKKAKPVQTPSTQDNSSQGEENSNFDSVEYFDILDDYVYIKNVWEKVDLRDTDENPKEKSLKEIADEMTKVEFGSTEQHMKKSVKDCYLFLNEREIESLESAVHVVLLHGNTLIEIGKMGVDLFQDIINKVNQVSYQKRMEEIRDYLRHISKPRYMSNLESSIGHIEKLLNAKARKYYWAFIILGVVSLVGLIGLGIASIATFLGAFVGVPIVAGAGVAMAIGCSVAIPVVLNSGLNCREVSSFADKWEDKLEAARLSFAQVMDSEEILKAKQTAKEFENNCKLPCNEDCRQLVRIFYRLTEFGNSLKACVL